MGKQVTLVEMTNSLLPEENEANRIHLIGMLHDNSVCILTGGTITSIENDGAIINYDKVEGKDRVLADSVVIAVGLEPRNILGVGLRGKIPELHIIGDCSRPGKIAKAIWDGFRIARII